MTRITRSILAVAAAGACSVGIAVTAQASVDGKVLICHGTATGTESNPYVLISVGTSALAGHFDVDADGNYVPGHGSSNNEDFFPGPNATDCVGSE